MLGSVGQEFLNIVSISRLSVTGIHSQDEGAHSDGCVCGGGVCVCVCVFGEKLYNNDLQRWFQ